jgi:hypothetical protein
VRILQIKQAECALADGRLDEAYDLATEGDLRSCRDGQRLVGRLVEALVARGGEHQQAGHHRQALADCDKAEALGGNLPELAALRERIADDVATRRRGDRRLGDLVTAARRHVEDGRLSLAEQMLDDCDDDEAGRAELLRHEAVARRTAAAAAMSRAEAALGRGDCAAALEDVLAAREHHGAGEKIRELTDRVIASATGCVREHLHRGRLDLADSLLRRLGPLAGGGELEDLARIADRCRQAREQIAQGRLRRAAETLRLLRSMVPEAKWIREAVDAADRAAGAVESLRTGPLGTLSAAEADVPASARHAGVAAEASIPAEPDRHHHAPTLPVLQPAAHAGGAILPSRFLLQVDGAGSYVVFRQPRVTVGPISSSAMPDLGLMADPSLPIVTIERADGDYFLRSERPVHVNDQPTTGRLLADGDRIALSDRCRFRFRLPNAASGTAVLELSGTRLPQADARRAVLLDRELVLGAGESAHVRNIHMTHQAVLYVREGRMLCRSELTAKIDDRPLPSAAGMPMGRAVRVGPVGLVLTKM